MRKHKVDSLLACLLLIPTLLPLALAQTDDSQTARDAVNADKLTAARDPYTQGIMRGPIPDEMLSQNAQPRPTSLSPGRIPHSRPAHGAMWHQDSDGHHAAIGALIGFGIGAAVGAAFNQDQHTNARVGAPILFGAFGALIGAAVTGSHRWIYSGVHKRRSRQEGELASRAKPVCTEGSAEMKPDHFAACREQTSRIQIQPTRIEKTITDVITTVSER